MRRDSIAGTTGKPRPLVSGNHFFSADPDEFRAHFLMSPHPAGNNSVHPAALMLPHGGQHYTRGSVARLCSSLDLSEFDGFLLIAPVHREPSSTIWLSGYPGFETPFGEIMSPPIAKRDAIASLPHVRMLDIPFEEEPAFDLILSILASQTADKPVLPLLAGSGDTKVIEGLTQIMSAMRKKNYLPVLSINCSIPEKGGPVEFNCGEALFSLFADHFRETRLQWYHTDRGGYSSSLWVEPRGETNR